MRIEIAALIFCFILEIILQALWMLTDYRPIRERIKWSFRPKTLLFTFQKAFSALLLLITTLYFPLPHAQFDFILVFAGIVISIIGFIIAGWAKLAMNKTWAPAEQPNAPRQEERLVINGPFKFSRNPIYLGIILLSLGTCIAIRSYLIFLVLIPIIKFYKAAVREEVILESRYGKKYLEYKSKVHRFI
jgi:protein-S-isoprenylcysteine O-methyltransferase Ste14